MTIENRLNEDQVQILMNKMIGNYIWNVVILEDRVLQSQFGDPHLRVLQVPTGEQGEGDLPDNTRRLVRPTGRWTLFIEDGLWAVFAANLDCNRHMVDNVNENSCLNALNGQKITDVALNDPGASLRMKFDAGGELWVKFNVDFERNDQWMLFCDGEGILACDSQGEFLMEVT